MIAKLEQQGKKIFQWGEELVDITTLENLVFVAEKPRRYNRSYTSAISVMSFMQHLSPPMLEPVS